MHTPIVVWNTLVGRLRPQWLGDYVFVILVTHPKSYIETTDRRDFGSKVEVRTGAIVLGYPSTILRTAYRKQFYPKPMAPM